MTDVMGPFTSVAPSIRLILAMFRLYADIETNFGRAIVDLLKKQYPGQKVDVNPASVGHKLMAIARKQNQNDDQRSMDAIQDMLAYFTGAGKSRAKEVEVEVPDPKSPTGKKPGTQTVYERGEEWNFATQSADTWQEALDKIYANLRTKSISKSIETQRRKKREKSVDDAFGKRPEGGGAAEGGEARVPTSDATALGKALDDHAALKEFYDLIDSYIPDLKKSLSKDTGALFDLIFEHNVGTFGSDIKENMNQSSELKKLHPEIWDDFLAKWDPEIRKKNPGLDEKKLQSKVNLKWAAYLGDVRKKLLKEIWDFIDEHMTPGDYGALKEEFFSDTTPQAVRGIEKAKAQKQVDYQRGRDYRTILKARKDGKQDEPRVKNLVKKLEADLKKEGKSLEEELAKEEKKGAPPAEEEGQSQTSAIVRLSEDSAIVRAIVASSHRPWA